MLITYYNTKKSWKTLWKSELNVENLLIKDFGKIEYSQKLSIINDLKIKVNVKRW